MIKVYIAGPINAASAVDHLKNMHKFYKAQHRLTQDGIASYNPAANFMLGVMNGNYEYHHYADCHIPWLKSSDIVYLLPGWEDSNGTLFEIDIARQFGIPTIEDYNMILQARDIDRKECYGSSKEKD